MKRLLTCLPVLAMLSSAGCGDPVTTPVEEVKSPTLAVEWQPIDNSVGSWKFFRSTFTLENQGKGELSSQGWKLYFSFVRRVLKEGEGDETGKQELANQGIKITQAASGDYYVIEPLENFKPVAPGEKRTLSVLFSDWAILKTDAPAGFHLVLASEPTKAVAVYSTVKLDAADPKQTTRFEGDVMPVQTPGLRYAENPTRQELDLQARLLPGPRKVQAGTGQVSLQGAIAIGRAPGLETEAAYLSAALKDVTSATLSTRAPAGGEQILLRLQNGLDTDGDGQPNPEGYLLDVKDGQIIITGADAAGVFYGIQTMRQLIPAEVYAAAKSGQRPAELKLPAVQISDAPGFVYRGMALDVARHFQSKDTVKRLLDVLSHYKINKFHFHLTDDEGWRLEIPGIPELTGFGSRRGFDPMEANMLHVGLGSGSDASSDDLIASKFFTSPSPLVEDKPQGFLPMTLNFLGAGSGFYTTKEFEEILVYAHERHIDVIPEVDVPGHARAAVFAMEHRYRMYKDSDPARAAEYRLVDPADTSKHQSVQMYTDNFINPCLETSYAFLGKVIKEIKARYDAAGVPLTAIHGGGDELPSQSSNVWWKDSPQCQQGDTRGMTDTQLFNRFFTRWNQIITSTGAKMTGWDDIIHNGLKLDGFMPMPWSNVWGWGREDDAYKFANEGYKVILSSATNLYMDLAHNKDPDEPGYYWANFVDVKKTFEYRPFDIFANATENRMGAPFKKSDWDSKERLTAAGKKNIIGMHGLLWAENLKTEGIMEYMAFPKVLGVAERAWNPELPAESEMPALWARFTNTLGQYVLPRLDGYRPVDLRNELRGRVGMNYRIPLPGAKISGGKLDANVLYPGLGIEYSTDGGKTWMPYAQPVSVSGAVLLRSRASDGRTSRTAEVK